MDLVSVTPSSFGQRPSISPEELALRWIARRTGKTPAVAAAIRDLTGLGGRREVTR